ncbi:MAG: GTPase HflX [Clostridia bacterium]|nr:GTPase HflX [Clostridia bacterium]
MLRFNENNEVITTEEYNAILVGLEIREDISYSMEELKGLTEAVNGNVLGMVIQKLERPNSATYIGKGKVLEIKEMVDNMEADIVIFNDELTGMQLRNLEDQIGVRVIDRTILILDIFARRAMSKEGKLQVELAQLKYRMPRLLGFGKSLSRQGAGIGTRGPGEKKLETDRRHIEERILDIKKELAQLKDTRTTQRSKREKSGVPIVALVGYTNAGKSALMNRLLCDETKEVFEENMLFATLDTSQRSVTLQDNRQFILIDTVGFVSKLPHSLVEAFKATLEEVKYADLLVHVVDSTYENYQFHIDVTEKVLDEIGAGDKERIIAFNKMDIAKDEPYEIPGQKCLYISAKRGDGIDELLETVTEKIFSTDVFVKLLVPFSRGDISSYLCDKAVVKAMDYREDGTYFEAIVKNEDYQRLREYEVI